MFAYNVLMARNLTDPATNWERDARQPDQPAQTRLRLAAMAGHMRVDKIAARRAALIDLLADGRPHPREEICEMIAAQLGDGDCWGKVPQEALARDLAALRRGGIRIAYSRRPGIQGYYLQYPALARPPLPPYEAVSWELIEALRQLSVPEKNKRAFAAADFALRQKRLILAAEHPNWPVAKVDTEARRLVYGITPELPT
jgi:DNA-binding transcriptional ArsR family regulator